jgi:hypothetical protein
VATLMGNSRFTNSGFSFTFRARFKTPSSSL